MPILANQNSKKKFCNIVKVVKKFYYTVKIMDSKYSNYLPKLFKTYHKIQSLIKIPKREKIKVLKRNGRTEELDVSKIKKYTSEAVAGLANVSLSELEVDAKIQFRIPTRPTGCISRRRR